MSCTSELLHNPHSNIPKFQEIKKNQAGSKCHNMKARRQKRKPQNYIMHKNTHHVIFFQNYLFRVRSFLALNATFYSKPTLTLKTYRKSHFVKNDCMAKNEFINIRQLLNKLVSDKKLVILVEIINVELELVRQFAPVVYKNQFRAIEVRIF